MARLVHLAVFVVAIGVAGSAPAAAQTVCTSGQIISLQTIDDDIVVDAAPGACTITSSTVFGGITVVSGSLALNGVNNTIFGDITAEPETSITSDGARVFGRIFGYLAGTISLINSRVGAGVEAKQCATLLVTGGYSGGLKAEATTNVAVSNGTFGDTVEIKDAGTLTVTGSLGSDFILEKGSVVALTGNLAYGSMKVVGSTTSTAVSNNRSPKLECSSNASLTQAGNTSPENLCVN
jgi:hypothetical protein